MNVHLARYWSHCLCREIKNLNMRSCSVLASGFFMILCDLVMGTQWLHVFGKNSNYYHVNDQDVGNSPSHVQQFFMDMAHLPSLVLPSSSSSFTLSADLFTHPKVNVFLFVQDGENTASTENGVKPQQSIVLNNEDFTSLPSSILHASIDKYGNESRIFASKACQLEEGFFHAIETTNENEKEETIDLITREMHGIVNSLKTVSTEEEDVLGSDIIILCGVAWEGKGSYIHAVDTFMDQLEMIYDNSVLLHVISSMKMDMKSSSTTRRLQLKVQEPLIVTPLTLQDIESYQVILWTAIGLTVTLLASLCCLCNMPIKRDSLLYAKFTTDAGHRKVN